MKQPVGPPEVAQQVPSPQPDGACQRDGFLQRDGSLQRGVQPEGIPPAPGAALDRLLAVVGQLRQHCPWTAALTPTSLRQYLVEECYELLDALEQVERAEEVGESESVSPDRAVLLDELRGELGDVLFQVVLHAEVQNERGAFGLGSVVEGLTAKLVRRNPHVFRADGSLQDHFPASIEDIVAAWQAVKSTEKPDRKPFEGIPSSLPALAFAAKSLSRAAAVGVSPAPGAAVDREARTAEEFGDRLFALAAAAVGQGIDPELALRQAVHRFQDSAADAP